MTKALSQISNSRSQPADVTSSGKSLFGTVQRFRRILTSRSSHISNEAARTFPDIALLSVSPGQDHLQSLESQQPLLQDSHHKLDSMQSSQGPVDQELVQAISNLKAIKSLTNSKSDALSSTMPEATNPARTTQLRLASTVDRQLARALRDVRRAARSAIAAAQEPCEPCETSISEGRKARVSAGRQEVASASSSSTATRISYFSQADRSNLDRQLYSAIAAIRVAAEAAAACG
eukprot:CAMPEP_0113686982 /NCGR_PEP_ID=MMETSP0038_2-20120614/15630_1 /TAXON_ID=2898 /ORGANISM="Cryptomonas paramecium" /LENGTH=233 /DNA_ID=CAMNT_0000607441 /DNA_START=158 /DNA_END=855 /DNA_ORIENTATION=+ /assembly_acc=CAM_ASM_000170